MIKYYFIIDDNHVDIWPHKYLHTTGIIDSLGNHNLPTSLASAAFTDSESVIEAYHIDDLNIVDYYYVKSRIRRKITPEFIAFIKLSSIEI